MVNWRPQEPFFVIFFGWINYHETKRFKWFGSSGHSLNISRWFFNKIRHKINIEVCFHWGSIFLLFRVESWSHTVVVGHKYSLWLFERANRVHRCVFESVSQLFMCPISLRVYININWFRISERIELINCSNGIRIHSKNIEDRI